jgi:starch phosphorylase
MKARQDVELRLRQEYFFVSALLQDLVHRHLRTDGDLHFLSRRAAIHLNDTHPSIAIAELMRLLVDVHGVQWSDAWRITVDTFSSALQPDPKIQNSGRLKSGVSLRL